MRAVPFFVPYIAGVEYAPGPQPYNPGESHQPWAGHMGLQFNPLPWPMFVQPINALANNSGTPRGRPIRPDVDRFAYLPSDYLYIAGFVGKSQG
jgi:hypothetical protein